MSVQDLIALKTLWGNDSPASFGRQVFDKIVDAIVAQEAKITKLKARVKALEDA